MKEYCVHTENIRPALIRDLRSLYIPMDIHLARTRFSLDFSKPRHYLFYLKYCELIHPV